MKTITKAVAKNVASYTSFAPSVYAGPTAKAAVLALSQDKNPRAFGGVDLIKQLEARVATTAPITGRIEDAFDPSDQFGGDFANVIGQSVRRPGAERGGQRRRPVAVTAFLLAAAVRQGLLPAVLHRRQDPARPVLRGCTPRGAPRQHRRDRARRPRPAGREGQGGQGRRRQRRRLAGLPPAGQRRVQRQRQARPRQRQRQQHRPGRLGASASPARRRTPRRPPSSCGRCRWRAPPRAPTSSARTPARSPSTPAPTRRPDKGITKKTSDQWRRASAQALPVLRWAPRAEGSLTVTAPARVPAGVDVHHPAHGRGPGPARLRRPSVASWPSTSRAATR